MPGEKKITPKQRKFAEAYVKTGNATESYKLAGYSWKTESTAGVNAHKLLKNHKISALIEELNQKLTDESIADIKEVKQFWTQTMRDRAEEMKERLKASEMLAKTGGAFLDRVEVSGEVEVNHNFQDLTTEELKKLAKEL